MRFLFLILCSAILTGCAVGPDYERPSTAAETPNRFGEAPTSPVAVDLERWWLAFEDPRLASLVDEALDGNPDLDAAVARVEAARAGLTAARAGFLPQVGLTGAAETRQGSAETDQGRIAQQFGGAGALQDDRFFSALSASWELDLFGGTRRERQAALTRLDRAEAGAAAAQTLIAAETARLWFGLQSLADQHAQARAALQAEQARRDRVVIREEAGLVDPGTEDRIEAAVRRLAAQERQLAAAYRENAYSLARVLGRGPDRAAAWLESPPTGIDARLPGLPETVPARLLDQRPDLRAAEAALRQAVAEQGVARAAFYPSIRLTGGYGFESTDDDTLLTDAAELWSFGPELRLPVFQGGRLQAGKRASDARAAEAGARFESAVLQALQEAESAFAGSRLSAEALTDLEAAEQRLERNLERQHARLDAGLAAPGEVFAVEAELARFRQELARAREAARLARVRLYTTLGGGWS
ncbi:MAG: efflux transporter outer membrane subunit [Opitutales bacterium]